MDAEKKQRVRPDIGAEQPLVPSMASRDSGVGTAIVITAATVLAALAVFIFTLLRRRLSDRPADQSDVLAKGRARSRATRQDAPVLDQGQVSPEQVATATVLDAQMEELIRLLKVPSSAPQHMKNTPSEPAHARLMASAW
jgi:hypothetical protein